MLVDVHAAITGNNSGISLPRLRYIHPINDDPIAPKKRNIDRMIERVAFIRSALFML